MDEEGHASVPAAARKEHALELFAGAGASVDTFGKNGWPFCSPNATRTISPEARRMRPEP